MTDAPKQMSAAEMRAEIKHWRAQETKIRARAETINNDTHLRNMFLIDAMYCARRATDLTRRLEEMEKTR